MVGKACDKPRRKLWMKGDETAPEVLVCFFGQQHGGLQLGMNRKENEK